MKQATEERGYDGYKLRYKRGSWYLELWLDGKDTGKDLGPCTFGEAQEFAETLIDMDKAQDIGTGNEG